MADGKRTIDQLPAKSTIEAADMFPLENAAGNKTYHAKWETILGAIPGVINIEKEVVDGVETGAFVVTLRDGSTQTIKVSDPDKQDKLTFDAGPTAGSSNPVTSAGIFDSLSHKVDAVAGMGLSHNDYTDDDKDKLSGLHNYDDTEVKSELKYQSVQIDNRIKKFYTSNLGEGHILDSDDGALRELKIYGKGEQKQYSGKNLFGFGLSVIDKTEEFRNNAVQRLVASKVNDNEVKFSFNGGNYSTAYLVIDGMDGTKDYAISFKVKDNTTSYTPNIVNDTSLSDVTKLVLRTNLTNQGGTVVDKSQYFILSEIQVERGSSATDFEPYVGGIPSPNPDYPQEIKSVVNPVINVCGKNLLNPMLETTTLNGVSCTKNSDGTYTLNGTATGNTNFRLKEINLKVDQNDAYKLVGCPSGGSMDKYCIAILDDRLWWTNFDTGNGQIIGVNEYSYRRIAIIVKNGTTVNNLIFKPMITTDLTATYDDFEPYQSTEATLPHTLNAIPVSSGGNVTIDGQEYIADYVDVERKKIIHMTYSMVLNGTEDWEKRSLSPSAPATSVRYSINISPSSMSTDTKSVGIFSNNTIISADEGYAGKTEGSAIQNTIISYYFVNNKYATIEEFKAYLQSNHAQVVYALATPIEKPLTDEQLSDLLSLRSHYPVTNVSVTSDDLDGQAEFLYPCSISSFVEYAKQQIGDTREFVYDMADISDQAFINAQYAEVLAEISLE